MGDADVGHGVLELIKRGYLNRILFSQDVCTKIHLKQFGGTGYSFIQEQFLPYLRRLGVTEAQIETIVVTNPKRVLTFAAPNPPPKT